MKSRSPPPTGNLNVFQRRADLAGRILQAVTCQICHGLPADPYRFSHSANRGGLLLTAPNSIDCRHLYCAPCLNEWWDRGQRVCYTCKHLCLYPPARNFFHGLLAWAHEDAGKRSGMNMGSGDPHFPQFSAPVDQAPSAPVNQATSTLVNQASSTPHDGSHEGGDEERMLVEPVEETAFKQCDDGTQELQLVPYSGGATPNI